MEHALTNNDGLYPHPAWEEVRDGDSIVLDHAMIPAIGHGPDHYAYLWYMSIMQQARRHGWRIKSHREEHGRRVFFRKKTTIRITAETVKEWRREAGRIKNEIEQLQQKHALYMARLENIQHFID